MICNNCIRGLTVERKEVCEQCAGTGFMAPTVQVAVQVPVQDEVQVSTDSVGTDIQEADVAIEEDGELTVKPKKKVLKK